MKNNLSIKNIKLLIALVVISATTGQLAFGLYLPSLPAIAASLQISEGMVQNSLAIFLFGIGVSQLAYGPLSDHYGRRKILLIGLTLLLLGTLVIVSFQTSSSFFIGRLLQGLGAGANAVLARAILRDCFSGLKLASAIALLIMAASITPTLTPAIGGYLQEWFNWRTVFVFIFIYTFVIAITLFYFLPETHPPEPTKKFRITSVLKQYAELLSKKTICLYLSCIVFTYVSQVLYLTIAPFILQKHYGLTASQFGLTMMLPAASLFVGNFISSVLAKSVRLTHIMFAGLTFIFLSALILLTTKLFSNLELQLVIIAIMVVSLGISFLFGNATAGLLHPFPKVAGTVAALSGCTQMIGSAGISAAISGLQLTSAFDLGAIYLALSVILFIVLRLIHSLGKHADLTTA